MLKSVYTAHYPPYIPHPTQYYIYIDQNTQYYTMFHSILYILNFTLKLKTVSPTLLPVHYTVNTKHSLNSVKLQ